MIASQHRPGGSRLLSGGGTKVKGLCVTHKYGYITGDWATDWVNWYKPQIDLAVVQGANCVKLYDNGQATTQNNGVSTAAQAINYPQFLTYAAQRGLLVYCVFGGPGTWSANGTTQFASMLGTWAALLNQFPNVIGIDLCNEINNGGPAISLAQTWVTAGMAAIRAVTNIPVTASICILAQSDLSSAYISAIAPLVDFIDIHPYLASGVAASPDIWADQIIALRTNSWWKQFLIGESGQSVAAGSRQPITWQANGQLLALSDCLGVMGFSVADFDVGPSNQWGMYGSDLTTSRAQVVAPFQQWVGHK
jgi:hypothetical protein